MCIIRNKRCLKGRLHTVFYTLLFLICINTSAFAEHIFLKNGSIINGRIVRDTADSITVKLSNGKTRTIARKSTMRILYTNLYMGKVYVQKTTGEGLELYMVDEDRNTYTFRKKLFSPREIVLRRDQVLFMARKNPSGLRGEPDTESISFKWQAPYNPVNEYKIFLKRSKNGKYAYRGTTSSKSITVSGLKSNTLYYAIVKAVDRDGYESLPSNEFKVTTKNILPDAPGGIKKKITLRKGRINVKLTWDRAKDEDGRVVGYRIYRYKNGKLKPVGKTSRLTYTLKRLIPDQKYRYYIRSIDNRNDESDDTSIIIGSTISVSLRGCFLLPIGDYGKMFNSGYGAMLNVSYQDYPFENMDLGVDAGYLYFSGKETLEKTYLLPLLATVRCRFQLSTSLSLVPRIGLGMSYNTLSKDPDGWVANESPEYESRGAFEPLVLAGGYLSYTFMKQWNVSAGSNFATIVENGSMFHFVSFYGSVGLRF